MLGGLLRENLGRPRTLSDFDKFKGVVAAVATDANVELTLVFRRGTVTLYEGVRGDADLVLYAPAGKILELSLLKIWHGVPNYLDGVGRNVVKDLLQRTVRIRGMLFHPIMLARFVRILSINHN